MVVVTDSTTINKTNDLLSPQTIKQKKDHHIWNWKYLSFQLLWPRGTDNSSLQLEIPVILGVVTTWNWQF